VIFFVQYVFNKNVKVVLENRICSNVCIFDDTNRIFTKFKEIMTFLWLMRDVIISILVNLTEGT